MMSFEEYGKSPWNITIDAPGATRKITWGAEFKNLLEVYPIKKQFGQITQVENITSTNIHCNTVTSIFTKLLI